MGADGIPGADDFLAPSFSVHIDGQELFGEISSAIESVTYESIDGIADMAKVVVNNPDFMLTDSKLFQIGNEMDIWIGYGTKRSHVGAAQIVRAEPDFPENAVPKIVLTGYTAEHRMMDARPNKGKGGFPAPKAKTLRGKKAPPKPPAPNRGAWDKTTPIHDIVAEKARSYGFEADIDDVPGPSKSIIQKMEMSDYELVKGLSNYTGYLFWVDGDGTGTWTLHFKKPEGNPSGQEKKYTFKYNLGDKTTLLGYQPEMVLRGAVSKLRAEYYDPDKGKLTYIEVEDDAAQVDTEFTGDVAEEITEEHTSAGAVKLFLGEFSIEVITNKRFKNPGELQRWAQTWFKRQRDNFVNGRGKVIGVESLRARQVHALEGIGVGLSGDHYFSRVKHQCDANGYWCDFTARKVIK